MINKNINIIKNYLKKNRIQIFKMLILLFTIIILAWFHFIILFQQHKQTKKNNIKLGIVSNIPPFSFDGYNAPNSIKTENGDSISGADVLLCQLLAQKLGKELVIKVYGFPGVLYALENNQVDLAIGMMNITEKRKEKMLAVGYFNQEVGILFKTKNKNLFVHPNNNENKNVSLLNLSHKNKNEKKIKLTTITGSVYDEQIKKYVNNNNDIFDEESFVLTRDEAAKCVDLIEKGIADAFIIDKPVIDMIIQNNESEKFSVLTIKNDFNIYPLGIFCKKNKTELKKDLEKALNEIKKEKSENFFEKLQEKALIDYKYLQKKFNNPQNQNFWKKLFITLPTYKKSFLMSFILSIDGLILGFIIALFFVKFKIFFEEYKKKHKNFLFYIQKIFFWITNGFINFLQAVPISVQALLFYNLLAMNIDLFKGLFGSFYTALIVILLNTAANLINIMLHNIKFLDKGQIEAAYALGMNQKQVFRYIIFEQSLKRTYPSIWNQFIINIKDTALFSIIGLTSLLWTAQRNIAITYDTFTPYFIVSFIYLILVSITNLFNKFKTKN